MRKLPQAEASYFKLEEPMKLGSNLQSLCKQRGWSLTRLAKESGVPIQTLHGWSTGRRSVDLKQVKKVAEAFKISIHHLVFGEPDPYEAPGEEILREIFSGDVRVTLHRIERKK